MRSIIRALRLRPRGLTRSAAVLIASLTGSGLLGTPPAHSEQVVLSVSQQQVLITSSFSGADLVVFGVAEQGATKDPSADVVVSARGPKQTFLTWRKSRVLGLWMNTDSRPFLDVPGYLSVQSNRPIGLMAKPELLRSEQLGLQRTLLVQRVGTDYADVVPSDPFRAAFLRIQEAHDLYQEDPNGVTFIAPNVFRAGLRIPGHAPLGRYDVTVALLRDGQVTGHAQTSFEVTRTGIEQEIADLARNQSLLYGVSVAFGSLIVGFLANLLFRKE